MRKVFAWVEIAAAVVLAVYAVILYVRVQFDSTAELLNAVTAVIRNYKLVTENGKIIADSTFKTVPGWRKILASTNACVANIKTACDDSTKKLTSFSEGKYVPNFVKDSFLLPLKQYMQVFSGHCGVVNANIATHVETIDKNFSSEQCEQIIKAFDQTLFTLDKAEKRVSGIQRDIEMYSLTILIVMLAISVCFFANGMVCILETKKVL